MKFRFFHIAAFAPEPGERELNAFCSRHRIVTVNTQFVAQGESSAWAVCVHYLEGDGPIANAVTASRRERVDYKARLSETDFAVYAELRALRKTLAEQEGVPVYALFTNEQLAEMVLRRVRTRAALAGIDGVGQARVDRYADAFLARLAELDAAEEGAPEASGRMDLDETTANRAG